MAIVIKNESVITYTLELTRAEAEYVKAALFKHDPKNDLLPDGDTVYLALDDAGVEDVSALAC